jgi:hypothetical protein
MMTAAKADASMATAYMATVTRRGNDSANGQLAGQHATG